MFWKSNEVGIHWVTIVQKGHQEFPPDSVIKKQTILHSFPQLFNLILLKDSFVSLYFSEFIAKVHIFRDLSPYRPFQELMFLLMSRKYVSVVSESMFLANEKLSLMVAWS